MLAVSLENGVLGRNVGIVVEANLRIAGTPNSPAGSFAEAEAKAVLRAVSDDQPGRVRKTVDWPKGLVDGHRRRQIRRGERPEPRQIPELINEGKKSLVVEDVHSPTRIGFALAAGDEARPLQLIQMVKDRLPGQRTLRVFSWPAYRSLESDIRGRRGASESLQELEAGL